MNPNECFFFQPTDYTSSATVCKWCGKEKYQHKSEQKQLIIDIMNDDAKDGLYKQQTAVEWLAQKYNYITWMRNRDEMSAEAADWYRKDYLEKAKEMEKEQHKNTWFDSTAQFDNAAEMTYKKTFEQYYNEEYGGNK